MKERNSSTQILYSLIASSRPLQAMLSISQPLFAAFLAVNGIPNIQLLALLIIGSTSGMFSVFALNDLLDYEIDKKTRENKQKTDKTWDMDAVFVSHPLTEGLITKRQQILWILITGTIAGIILFSLNSLALFFYLLAIILEILYCKLATISPLKTIVAGLLVSVGALIGWFAADGSFNFSILMPLILLFFGWEIGGRNIANDFSDIDKDKKIGIKTIPCAYGIRQSIILIFIFLFLTMLSNVALAIAAKLDFPYFVFTTMAGLIALILPWLKLKKNPIPKEALSYFNQACTYPVLLFIVLLLLYLLT